MNDWMFPVVNTNDIDKKIDNELRFQNKVLYGGYFYQLTFKVKDIIMALCNTAGLKSNFYIRRVLRHKKQSFKKLPLIDYYEKQIKEENKGDVLK